MLDSNVFMHLMLLLCMQLSLKHCKPLLTSLQYPLQYKLHQQCMMIKFLHKLQESLGLTNDAQTTYIEMAGDVADKVVQKIL